VRSRTPAEKLEATVPKPLTELERRVLDYLVEYLRTNTYQPSIREIGREFTIKSTKTVSELLQSLAEKGWIERDPSRSRGVRLIGLEMRATTVSLPVYARPDMPEVVGHYEIDRQLVDSNGAFLMAMAGDHLLEQGIRSGDLLLVDAGARLQFEPGDIVVLRAGPGTSVRRCSSVQPNVVLEPSRAGEAPLTLTPRQVQDAVLGRVTSVIRRLRPPAEPTALEVARPAG
jgi:repressor LexA